MKKYYTQTKINLIKKREVETWIYSYADLVTNLLALFIMLFVLSNRWMVRRTLLEGTAG